MRAAVLRDVGVLELSDVPEPEPVGADSVLVRMGAVGVCGSDVLRYAKGKGYGFPLVLGHEMSATVAEPSPSGRLRPGDRVAVFPCLPVADDPMTEIGEFVLGEGYDYFGSRRDGGMQEVLRVPERNLVPLAPGMSLIQGAMVEPAAVALHAMRKVHVPADATALVIGAGPIGLLAAQWLRVLGVIRVLVADVDERKRAIAAHLGFETIDATASGSDAQARELTGGRGVDIAVEASGLAVTLLQAIHATAARGQLVIVGDLSQDVTIPAATVSTLLRREVTVYGTWNSRIAPRGNSEWDMVVNAIAAGRVRVDDLVSSVATLDEAPHVFAALASRATWANKTIFAISEDAAAEAADALARSLSARRGE
jgi:L-iditol 2-dehydrogenase/galactitol-1-phosphate 5-dehydrogenase